MEPVDHGRLDDIGRRLSGPGWAEFQKQRQFLTDPLLRSLAAAVGADLADLDSQDRELREGLAALLQAAILFPPLGWTVSASNLRATDYIEAVALWHRSRDPAAIDAHLTRAWADPVWLRHSYGPMTTLAGRHEPTLDLLLERNRLLDKALSHHLKVEFEASVLIVLSQIDGLTYQFTDPRHGFFFKAKADNFVDDSTIAGMPEVLRAVYRYVIQDPRDTSLSDALHRSPIMHGRQLAFGTETNSTKAFALLAGVVEWLKPKAAELTERWQSEEEAKYAGTRERDAQRRLRDRRGFAETREVLRSLSIRQWSAHRASGCYESDLTSVVPKGGVGQLRCRGRTTLAIAPDGQSYWAWCQSDTDVCFGIAARDGGAVPLLYADVGAPGSPEEDARWVQESDEPPPDWSAR